MEVLTCKDRVTVARGAAARNWRRAGAATDRMASIVGGAKASASERCNDGGEEIGDVGEKRSFDCRRFVAITKKLSVP